MNRSTRTIVVATVLVAILLAAALPAAAKQPDRTDFTARGYICEMAPAAREWYTDGGTVWHIRNMRYKAVAFSDEPRIAGMVECISHQDLDQSTGDGRAWATCVTETAKGTWHMVYQTVYTAGDLFCQLTGHGSKGLEGQSMYWEGVWLFPPYPDLSPCGDSDPLMAFQAAGYILDRKGH